MTWDDSAVEGLLQAEIALRLWVDEPWVTFDYDAYKDRLVIEFVDIPPTDEIVRGRLLVEYAVVGGLCVPTRLCLAGVRTQPDRTSFELARAVVGEYVFGQAIGVTFDRMNRRVEYRLDDYEVAELRSTWDHIPDHLLPPQVRPYTIGLDVLRDRVRAGVVDRRGGVLGGQGGIAEQELEGSQRGDVTEAARKLVDDLVSRFPEATGCDIGVRLSGPVDSVAGIVLFYGKLLGAEEPVWDKEPLAASIAEATGCRTFVANDAEALALDEVQFGSRRYPGRYVVVLVGDGVGARLVEGGVVAPYPMEIGIYRPNGGRTIEERASVSAILRKASAMAHLSSLEDVVQAAQNADEVGAKIRALLRDAASALASALSTVRATVGPEAIIVHAPTELVKDLGEEIALVDVRLDEFVGWSGLRLPAVEWRAATAALGVRAGAAVARSR